MLVSLFAKLIIKFQCILAPPIPVHAADVTDDWGKTPPYIARWRPINELLHWTQDEQKNFAEIVDYFKSVLHSGEQ